MREMCTFKNHYTKRAYFKKLRRKLKRRSAAIARQQCESATAAYSDSESSSNSEAAKQQEEIRLQQEAKWILEDTALHTAWKLKQQQQQQMLLLHIPPNSSGKLPQSLSSSAASARPPDSPNCSKAAELWHNPFPPQQQDSNIHPTPLASWVKKQECNFFVKTGACRFGISATKPESKLKYHAQRCSRLHPLCASSCILLLPHMFFNYNLEETVRRRSQTDAKLEIEEDDIVRDFVDFYWDIYLELRKFGEIVTVKVCRNASPHLRGHVYVQYNSLSPAVNAQSQLHGRWFAGRQLSCHFVQIPSWRVAVCGLYVRQRCPKGDQCNFLHVFLNPGESTTNLLAFMRHSEETSGHPVLQENAKAWNWYWSSSRRSQRVESNFPSPISHSNKSQQEELCPQTLPDREENDRAQKNKCRKKKRKRSRSSSVKSRKHKKKHSKKTAKKQKHHSYENSH